MADVYIAHSHADKDLAAELTQFLIDDGLKVNLPDFSGGMFSLEDAVRHNRMRHRTRAIIILWTTTIVHKSKPSGARAQNILLEARRASSERKAVHVLADGVEGHQLPPPFDKAQHIRFDEAEILRAIRTILSGPRRQTQETASSNAQTEASPNTEAQPPAQEAPRKTPQPPQPPLRQRLASFTGLSNRSGLGIWIASVCTLLTALVLPAYLSTLGKDTPGSEFNTPLAIAVAAAVAFVTLATRFVPANRGWVRAALILIPTVPLFLTILYAGRPDTLIGPGGPWFDGNTPNGMLALFVLAIRLPVLLALIDGFRLWPRILRAAPYATGGLAATAAAMYGLAILALYDRQLATRERFVSASDLSLSGGELATLTGNDGTAQLHDEAGRLAIVRGHAAPVTQTAVLGNGAAILTIDESGAARLTDPGRLALLEPYDLSATAAHVKKQLWNPTVGALADWSLSWVAQVFDLWLPDHIKGARGPAFRDCAECPEMIVIEPGMFLMGSTQLEPGRQPNEGWRKLEHVRAPFAIGRFPDARPSWLDGNGLLPAAEIAILGRRESISDQDLLRGIEFLVSRLSARSGRSYSLSNAVSWEYAVRAGQTRLVL